VLVFNASDPYQIAEDSGISISTSMETNVIIKRSFLTHMDYPYGECLEQDVNKINWNKNDVLQFMKSDFIDGNFYDNGNWTWNWTLTYSRYVCVKLCFQKYLFDTCKCKSLFFI
jgi:hypothetical protein